MRSMEETKDGIQCIRSKVTMLIEKEVFPLRQDSRFTKHMTWETRAVKIDRIENTLFEILDLCKKLLEREE